MNCTIDLKALYTFAKNDVDLEGMNGSGSIGKDYGKLVKEITNNISDNPGFYIWGKFNRKNYWESIYIGQSGIGKTAGLRGRILKELNSERALVWQYYFKEELLNKKCREFYPAKYETYLKQWKRAYRRSGTTYIITIPTKLRNNKKIENVESDLIETMNPLGNRKRPKPNTEGFLDESIRVIKCFKQEINEIRKEKLPLFRLKKTDDNKR